MCKLIVVLFIMVMVLVPEDLSFMSRINTDVSIKMVEFIVDDNKRAEEISGIGMEDGIFNERDEKFSVYYAQGS